MALVKRKGDISKQERIGYEMGETPKVNEQF
jgi:hypothetical protein